MPSKLLKILKNIRFQDHSFTNAHNSTKLHQLKMATNKGHLARSSLLFSDSLSHSLLPRLPSFTAEAVSKINSIPSLPLITTYVVTIEKVITAFTTRYRVAYHM